MVTIDSSSSFNAPLYYYCYSPQVWISVILALCVSCCCRPKVSQTNNHHSKPPNEVMHSCIEFNIINGQFRKWLGLGMNLIITTNWQAKLFKLKRGWGLRMGISLLSRRVIGTFYRRPGLGRWTRWGDRNWTRLNSPHCTTSHKWSTLWNKNNWLYYTLKSWIVCCLKPVGWRLSHLDTGSCQSYHWVGTCERPEIFFNWITLKKLGNGGGRAV